MIKKGLSPRIRPALDRPGDGSDYRRVLPFKRAWEVIAILAVFDLIFLVPAIHTFQQAVSEWSKFDDLFDLVAALFLSAWLLGWSIAPILLTTVVALMMFGREVIKVHNDQVVIFFGLPGIGVAASYRVSSMRNMRIEHPQKKSGKSWRGDHVAFDYGANPMAVGSELDHHDLADILNGIRSGSGQSVRRGDATPEELSGEWQQPDTLALQDDPQDLPNSHQPDGEPLSLTSPSTLVLILVNLVPLAGAAFLGWDLGNVMVLYWAESAVIGFFNVCKIIVISRWFALLAVPFFIGHFGGFMAVHFLFIYGLFIQGPQDTSGGDLTEVAQMFIHLWPALALLFVSHAFSFVRNFLGRREYRNRSAKNLMSEPYGRIIFMHLVVILGGGLTLVLGESTPVLMVVIALKIWIDVKAHLKQRVKNISN